MAAENKKDSGLFSVMNSLLHSILQNHEEQLRPPKKDSQKKSVVDVERPIVCPVCGKRSKRSVRVAAGPFSGDICIWCARAFYGIGRVAQRFLKKVGK